MTLPRRLRALLALADELEDRRRQLEAAMVATMAVARRVAEAEVDLALLRLRGFRDVEATLAQRRPLGTVAVTLAGNALVSNPAATIGTAFVTGNTVRVRFPSGSRAWAAQLSPIFERHLVGVSFHDGPGSDFVRGAATERDVKVAVVFGADTWMLGYEPLFRATGTKLVFEGAGNCPMVVLTGADVSDAAEAALRGAFYNAGQACTSPERAYVEATLYDEFLSLVSDGAASLRLGAPESLETVVGPIVRTHLVERISRQLADARRRGAVVTAGGRIEAGRLRDGSEAAWVQPTVLTNVTPEMEVMREETFGPVLTVSPSSSAAEAVKAASDSDYGLVASVFGGEPEEAQYLAGSHGRVLRDEIWLSHDRRVILGLSGGRKRSGWVWDSDGGFTRRDGPRWNVLEFSTGDPTVSAPDMEVVSHA